MTDPTTSDKNARLERRKALLGTNLLNLTNKRTEPIFKTTASNPSETVPQPAPKPAQPLLPRQDVRPSTIRTTTTSSQFKPESTQQRATEAAHAQHNLQPEQLAIKVKAYELPRTAPRAPVKVTQDAYSRLQQFCWKNDVSALAVLTYLIDKTLPAATQATIRELSSQPDAAPPHITPVHDVHFPSYFRAKRNPNPRRVFPLYYALTPWLKLRLQEAKKHRFSRADIVEAIIEHNFLAATHLFTPRGDITRL